MGIEQMKEVICKKNILGLTYSQRWFFWIFSILSTMFFYFVFALLGGHLIASVEPSHIAKDDLSYLKSYYFYDDSDEITLTVFETKFRFFDNWRSDCIIEFEVTPNYYDNHMLPNKENLPWLYFPSDFASDEQRRTTFGFSVIKYYSSPYENEPPNQTILNRIKSLGRKALIFEAGTVARNTRRSAVPALIGYSIPSIFFFVIGCICKKMKGKRDHEKTS